MNLKKTKTDVAQKILRAMQESDSFANTNVLLQENDKGNLIFTRNYTKSRVL